MWPEAEDSYFDQRVVDKRVGTAGDWHHPELCGVLGTWTPVFCQHHRQESSCCHSGQQPDVSEAYPFLFDGCSPRLLCLQATARIASWSHAVSL